MSHHQQFWQRSPLLDRLAMLVCVMAPACGAVSADEDLQLQGAVRAHDPSSVVEHAGRHYLFFTGPGISAKSSADLTEWQAESAVFDQGATPEWISDYVPGFRGHYWAPDLIELDGKYLLYYSVSRFGRQTSAIGLAVNETLDPKAPNYAWRDAGMVVKSSADDPYNAIDPTVLLDDDGRLWMAFGSYWDGIFLVELDAETGGRLEGGSQPVQLAHAKSIEAATLIRHGQYYYLFINHGTCCRGVQSTYKILVGRSKDIAGPYVDHQGRRLLDGGGTLVLDSNARRIGPGHVAPVGDGQEQFAFHFYDGEDRGRSKIGIASWQWSDDGWPSATNVRLADPTADPPRRRWPR